MNSLPDDVMKKLQDDYMISFATKLETLRDANAKDDRPTIKQVFHKLAGTGATYLMPEITTLGRAAEEYLEKSKAIDKEIVTQAIALMTEVFEKRKNGSVCEVDGHSLLAKLKPKL